MSIVRHAEAKTLSAISNEMKDCRTCPQQEAEAEDIEAGRQPSLTWGRSGSGDLAVINRSYAQYPCGRCGEERAMVENWRVEDRDCDVRYVVHVSPLRPMESCGRGDRRIQAHTSKKSASGCSSSHQGSFRVTNRASSSHPRRPLYACVREPCLGERCRTTVKSIPLDIGLTQFARSHMEINMPAFGPSEVMALCSKSLALPVRHQTRGPATSRPCLRAPFICGRYKRACDRTRLP